MKISKSDIPLYLTIGAILIVLCFIAGILDGIEEAMNAQLQANYLSVYCQQPMHNETLCPKIPSAQAAD